MGYIEKRGRASWRLVTSIDTPAGPQVIRSTIRMDPSLPESVQRRDAERELRNLEKRLRADAPAAYTLRSWSEEWITRQLPADCSPVTVSNYRYFLSSRILPALGDYPLEDLTPAILSDWLAGLRTSPRKTTRKDASQLSRDRRDREQAALLSPSKLARPLSAKTILHYYATLDTCLSAAVRLGYLEHNPMDRVQRPRQRKHARPILTEDAATDLIRLLADLPEKERHYRLAILLALLCGLRLGEVCALKYQDVDWTRSTISISRAVKYTPSTGRIVEAPKSDASAREITLPPSMLDLLRESWDQDTMDQIDMASAAEQAGKKSPYTDNNLIIHSRSGAPVNKDTPSKWFRRFADAHGFQGVTFHDLRHAHASILVAHNVDIAAVASRMGHADAGITLSTYTHPFRDHDRTAAQILDALLQPPAQDPAADPSDAPAADPAAPDSIS